MATIEFTGNFGENSGNFGHSSGKPGETSGRLRGLKGKLQQISDDIPGMFGDASGTDGDFLEDEPGTDGETTGQPSGIVQSNSEFVRELFGIASTDSEESIQYYLAKCVKLYEKIEKTKNEKPKQEAAMLLKAAKQAAEKRNLKKVMVYYDKLRVKRNQQKSRKTANVLMYEQKQAAEEAAAKKAVEEARKNRNKYRLKVFVGTALFLSVLIFGSGQLLKWLYQKPKAEKQEQTPTPIANDGINYDAIISAYTDQSGIKIYEKRRNAIIRELQNKPAVPAYQIIDSILNVNYHKL